MSVYILAPLLAWLLAQGTKVALYKLHGRSVRKTITSSGGMPSAHSALVVSVSTVIAARDGLESPLFALAAVIALITMYDAVNVRRAVGEQGKVLKELAKNKRISFKRAAGHTLPEVLAGITVGVIAAWLALSLL
ncbi:MAG TPA: divergent PAP2 family protein [Candidatus Saccharimonadales bacterium]